MNSLEEYLAKKYGKSFCIFTANGTTAMYLVFLALDRSEKKVLFPAISCTNPVNAAIFAGYEVGFCDVNCQNYTMDISSLKDNLSSGEYGIIVPTHIYGHRYNVNEVNRLAKKYGAYILEDAAQTYCVGTSDISITSFGHTKLFETTNGGGAIFTDDEILYSKINKAKKNIKNKPTNANELFDEYRKKYYSITKNSQFSRQERNNELRKLQLTTKDIFIYDMTENYEVIEACENSRNICDERVKKAKLYEKGLDKKFVIAPINPEGIVPWRYTFLYKGNRESLLDKARAKGIDISSWYPSLSDIYLGHTLKNASYIEKQVVNLWVSEDHSENRIITEIETLNNIMLEDFNGCK